MESLCLDFDAKYIDFELADNHNPNTWIVNVIDEESNVLGKVKWFAHWRQYAFYPEPYSIYEKTCMQDIINFIKLINKQQKNGIKPENPQRKLIA